MKLLKLPAYCFPEQTSSSHLANDLENAYIDAGFDVNIIVPTPTRGVTTEKRKELMI